MILALETSTRRASLAVLQDTQNQILWEESFETDRSHNSVIFDPVGEALEKFGEKITTVAVGLGPGSYGGVRVGIAVANGLSLARDWKTVGVSSLEAYGEGDDCFIVGDARRKTFFLARVSEGMLQEEPSLLTTDELETRLAEAPGKVYSADESVVERFPIIELAFPQARRIGERAARGSSLEASEKPLEPNYLRAPYITTPKAKKSG